MWENRAMRPSPRVVFAAIAVASAALVAYAIYYMQEQLGLDPCPMRGRGLKVYASLITLLALCGIGVSIRHSYLQHFPPKMETCGTDLEFLLNALPLSQALPKIFAGTGSCSRVDWKFLGLSIPEWSGVWFAVFAALALWVAWRRGNEKRRG